MQRPYTERPSNIVTVCIIVPLQQHDYRSEQPVTIWTEMRDRAHVSELSITSLTAAY